MAIFGLGYVGLPLAVVLAEKGFNVLGIDTNPEIRDTIMEGTPHFFETGLEPLLKKCIGKNFEVRASIEKGDASVFIITVGTPLSEGERVPDLTAIKMVSRSVGRTLKRGDLVILRSTVPIGVTRRVTLPILEQESQMNAGGDFFLAFAPERVIEGAALEELVKLPQVVGGVNEESTVRARDFFQTFVEKTIVVRSLETAEIIKLANNAYRDTIFGFANEFSRLCGAFNIDPQEVVNAANANYPRGHIPSPSPGVGGYCLTKDPYILMSSAESRGISMSIIHAGRKSNEVMVPYILKKVQDFFENIRKKDIRKEKIALLGMAFKGWPETSDIRFSPSIDMAKLLRKQGAEVWGHDFAVPAETLTPHGIKFALSIEKAVREASCIILMTNHPRYQDKSWLPCLEALNTPALFFDPWRLWDEKIITSYPQVYYTNLGYSSFYKSR